MNLNYNSLSSGRDTRLKTDVGVVIGSSPTRSSSTSFSWFALFLLVFLFCGNLMNAQATYYSKASATNFASTSSWGPNVDGSGIAPASISGADYFVIANNAALTLNANATVGKLTMNTGGLTVGANTLTIQSSLLDSSNKTTLAINSPATLTVSGGTVNLFGNMTLASGGVFNQSGGNFNVDGNNAGSATGSVATGTVIVNWTPLNFGSVNLTGGTFTIVDPHVGTGASDYTFNFSYATAGNTNTTMGHTFRFGDGVSTDTTTNTGGFICYNWPGTGGFRFGNLIINGGSAARMVTSPSSYGAMPVLSDLTINANSELRQTGTSYTTQGMIFVGRNLINNGILTTTQPGVYFGNAFYTSGTAITPAPSSLAQTVSGTGKFRNAITDLGSTANFGALSFNNATSAGVLFSDANSLLCKVTPINNTGTVSTSTNFFTGDIDLNGGTFVQGTSTAIPGTFSFTSGGFKNGTITRWLATTTLATSATTPTANFFPFSKNGSNRSIGLAQSAALTTAGYLSATYTDAVALNTGVSFTDAGYTAQGGTTINRRTNASWSLSTANVTGLAANTLVAAAQTFPININPSGVLLMNVTPAASGAPVVCLASASAPGTHATPTGTAAAPIATRTGITLANLTSNTFYVGNNNTVLDGFYTIASGEWSSGSIWSGGVAPGAGDLAKISPGNTITVTSGTNLAAGIQINGTGSLSISAGSLTVTGGVTGAAFGVSINTALGVINLSGTGTLTIGSTGQRVTTFSNTGTLNVTGGTLNVNGNMVHVAGSNFNQSGGAINIDGSNGLANYVSTGNATSATNVITLATGNTTNLNVGDVVTVSGGTGALAAATTVSSLTATTITVSPAPTTALSGAAVITAAKSVPSATALLAMNSQLVNLTAGTIKIINPHFGATNQALAYSSAVSVDLGTNHNFVFGDGSSTISGNGATASGFLINPFVSTGRLAFGNLTINGTPLTTTSTLSGVSSATTTVTVTSTAGLKLGSLVTVTGGTGAFAANSYISNILTATTFTVSATPTTALSAATVTVKPNNRQATITVAAGVLGNLLVTGTDADLRFSGVLHAGGNVTVDSGNTFTNTGTLALQNFASGVTTAVTSAQTVSGAGRFRNSAATADALTTACNAGITINNSHASGVTFSGNALYNSALGGGLAGTNSGTLTFTQGTLYASGNPWFVGHGVTTPAVATVSVTAGGFGTGTTVARWFPATNTGTPITAAALPTSTSTLGSGTFPFVSGNGATQAQRFYFLNRTTPAGAVAGTVRVTYNDAAGVSNVSPNVVDGTYTVDTRTNSNWVVTRGDGFTKGTAEVNAVAMTGTGIYTVLSTDAVRVLQGTTGAPVASTHQAGTLTPQLNGQRSAIPVTTPLEGTYYLGYNLADAPLQTQQSGPWGDPNTWAAGAVPACPANVQILTNHNITLPSGSFAANSLIISGTGTLTLNGGDLSLGCVGNIAVVSLQGTSALTVTSGNLTVNGRIDNSSTTSFTQNGGTITVDGNNNGDVATSVATGTPIVGLAGTVVLTGGTMTIVDPHVGTAATDDAFRYTNTASVSALGHTLQLGNGVSTDLGGNATNGFSIEPYASSGRLMLGNVIVNTTSTGTTGNRFVAHRLSTVQILGDLTVTSGRYLIGTSVNVAGNITNNGEIVTTSTLGLQSGSGTSTIVPSSVAQTISGSGIFSNSLTASTANFTNLTVNNSNATGITFNGASSVLSGSNTGTVSGTLNLTTGFVTSTNEFILGTTAASNGTLTYTDGGFTSGSLFSRWWPTTTGGATITAGSRPTATTVGVYPFVTGAAFKSRIAYLNQTAAATTGGRIAVSYVDVAGTSPLSIIDGAYTVETVSNSYWNFNAAGISGTPTYTVAINAKTIYDGLNGNSRIIEANGLTAMAGTHQNGTGFVSAQRTAVPLTSLSNSYSYKLGAAILDIVQPCTGAPATPTFVTSTFTTCSGTAAGSVTATVPPNYSGVTYQWEESDDNGVTDAWATAVGGSGATTITYTFPILAANRYYRIVATCGNPGGSSAASASIVVKAVGCDFNVTRTTGITYNSIAATAPTAFIGFSGLDDSASSLTDIGFDFFYKGTTFTQFAASTNGSLSLGAIVSTYSNSLSSNNVIAPYWDDLYVSGGIAANIPNFIKYQLDGVAGSRVLTVEWIGMEQYAYPGPNMNFQVKLYEGSNKVEIIHGSMEPSNGTTSSSLTSAYSYSLGVSGPSTATGTIKTLSLQGENTNIFGSTDTNTLAEAPQCNVKYTFEAAAAYTGSSTFAYAAPSNDEPAGAITLGVPMGELTNLCGTYYTTGNATASSVTSTCASAPDDDVWFKFVAPASGVANVSVKGGTGFDPVVSILNSSLVELAGYACINATTGLSNFGLSEAANLSGLVGGATYYVRVSHNGTGFGSRSGFSISVSEPAPPPSNDNPCGAIDISAQSGLTCASPYIDSATNSTTSVLSATTTTSNGVTTATCSGAGASVNDVWFKFTATSNSHGITLTPVPGFDVALQGYVIASGSCATNDLVLTPIGCVNGGSTGFVENVVLTAVAGQTYYIRIYRHPSGATGAPVNNSQFSICKFDPIPLCTTYTAPANAATAVSTLPTFTWATATYAAGYKIYIKKSTDASYTLLQNVTPGTATTYTATTDLIENTTYDWYVLPYNGSGDSACTNTYTFTTIFNAPTFTSFTPAAVCQNSNDAGRTVVIAGNNFLGATSVLFNDVAVQSYTIDNNNQITAIIGNGVTANTTGFIKVVKAFGTGTSSLQLTETYITPITAITSSTPGVFNICLPSETITLSEGSVGPGVEWISSDENIASIDPSGVITANNEGSVTITRRNTVNGCVAEVTQVVNVYAPTTFNSAELQQVINPGQSTQFSVDYTGSNLTYAWEESTDFGDTFHAISGFEYSGLNTNTLLISGNGQSGAFSVPNDSYSGNIYRCTITGSCGSETQDATLYVGALGISPQPASATICSSATSQLFTIGATGSQTVSYQWQKDAGGDDWQDLVDASGTYSGVTTANLTVSGAALINGSRFRCHVADTDLTQDPIVVLQSLDSNVAILTVTPTALVDTAPADQTVCYTGGASSFTVTATGGVASYQWKYATSPAGPFVNNVQNGIPAGTTYTGGFSATSALTSTLNVTTTGTTPVANYYYAAVITSPGSCGSVTSTPAALKINGATVTGPVTSSVVPGGSTTFSVVVTPNVGSVTPTYQWQYATTVNGTYTNVNLATPITGVSYTNSTSATLTVTTTSGAVASATNYYRVVITLGSGCTITTTGAQLSISSYCASYATDPADDDIAQVTFGTFVNPASMPDPITSNLAANQTYTDYTALASGDFERGTSYPLSVAQFNEDIYYRCWTKVFIDWNHDGDFADAGEAYNAAGGVDGAVSDPNVFSMNVIIPTTAALGSTRMRIVLDEYGTATSTPIGCGTYTYGETEDYNINVTAAPCDNPSGGTATGDVTFCGSNTPTITASGYSTAVSSYQWYSSTSAADYAANTGTAIVGQTNPAALTSGVVNVTTYFWLVSTCSNATTGKTNMVTVSVNSANITGTASKCASDTALITLTASAGDSYLWSTGATTRSIQVSPTITTTYTVGVTYTAAACAANGSFLLTVNPDPTAPTVTPTSAPAAFCLGASQALTATAGASGPATLLTQTFESGLAPWTAVNSSTGGTTPASVAWTQRATNYASGTTTFTAPQGTSFAIANADGAGSGITALSTLTSPSFNTVGYTGLSLTFKQYYRHITAAAAFVEVSTNGTTWTTVQSYSATTGTAATFASATVDLAAYLGNATLSVRFRYAGGWYYYWAVDDVKVTATAPVLQYVWTASSPNAGLPVGATTASAANASITVTPTVAGSYTYTAKTVNVTTGCTGSVGTTTAAITVNGKSTAAVLSGTSSICGGTSGNIKVTVTGGTSPYTVVYSDGTSNFTVNSYVSASNISVSPTSTKTYSLVSVTSTGGCAGTGNSGTATITVIPNPTATVSNSGTICYNGTATFTITGSSGATATYNVNGGTPVQVFLAGGTATVNVANATSNRILTVTSVAYGACSTPLTASSTVTVNINGASVTGGKTVCVDSAPAPEFTFTGTSGTAPYTFTYTINNGSPLTVTTTSGSSVTVAAPTNVVGSFVYRIVNVQDAFCTNAITPVSGTMVISTATATYYADTDTDTFGDLATTIVSCSGAPSGYVANSTDCAPADATKWRTGLFYTDADGDGYNNGAPQTSVCYGAATPIGYVVSNIGTDCLDSNFEVNPNHVEVMGNSIDDNCDGVVDEVAPTSGVLVSQCSSTLTNLAQTIYCGQVPGAQGYRFEVTQVGNPTNVRTYDSEYNRFNLLNLYGGATYATTYSIRVAVKTAPGFWRSYSSTCSVSTPSVALTTTISSPTCGITLSNIATTIYCDAVANATGYRFRVTDGVTSSIVQTSVNRFNLTNANANFGTTYAIDVQLRFGSTWETTWGSVCSFTTPATPGTSNVSAAQCGINIPNLWTTIYATQISVATGYRFEVTKSGGGTVFYDTPNARFSLRNITVPGFTTTNASYSIRVSILYNSIYQAFGSPCTITTNGASRVTTTPVDVFEVNAYPNPFAANFKLEINTSSENNVGVKVYDMIGRQIEVRQSSLSQMTTLEIGDLYPTGVYNIVVTQGDKVKTLRVIKR